MSAEAALEAKIQVKVVYRVRGRGGLGTGKLDREREPANRGCMSCALPK